jgi:hypothetical protein
MDYRNDARLALERAKAELSSGLDNRLKYAALELRMAMEAVTYDRALAYKDEFPPREYETWQPRKVMSVLLEIDPTADKDSSLSFGREEEYGVQAPLMNFLGTEKVLNMITLKHYDALGSYLHVQSMKQSRLGKQLDFSEMRLRFQTILRALEEVLSSPIFNVRMGHYASLDCVECGNKIRKKMPHEKIEVSADCFEVKCPASYTIVQGEDDQVTWTPNQHPIKCANKECEREIVVWHREMQLNAAWTCPDCEGRNVFSLAVRHLPKAQQT